MKLCAVLIWPVNARSRPCGKPAEAEPVGGSWRCREHANTRRELEARAARVRLERTRECEG